MKETTTFYFVFICGAHYATFPARCWSKAWEEITNSPRAKVYAVAFAN